MDQHIKGKVVVITGGASGIGYELAKTLANDAKLVIILDINETEGVQAAENLNETIGVNKVVFMKCDITKDLDSVTSEIFQKYSVDILINNAGVFDENSVKKVFAVNAIGAIECAMKFWEHMRKDTGGYGGTILNMISIYGYKVMPLHFYYTSSKHAMAGFTKSIGHQYNYEKFGVRVIGLCPGYTDTGILTEPIFASYHLKECKDAMKIITVQPVEVVGKAVIDILKEAESGSLWGVEDNKPIYRVCS